MSDNGWGVMFEGGEPAQTQAAIPQFLAALFGSHSKVLRQIGEYFTDVSIFGQWESQGLRGSGGWPDLAPETIKRKGHSLMLYDTGELINSWESPFTGIDEITIRNKDYPKVLFHTDGTERMPARPPFVVTAEDLDNVERIFVGSFDDVFEEAFGQ